MRRQLLWIVGLSMLPVWSLGQTKKPIKAKPAPTVQELILAGKIPEAVRQAAKAPNLAVEALTDLMVSFDLQITERKTAEAQATLDAAMKFLNSHEKASKGKPPMPRDAWKGRELRLQGIKLNDQKEYAKAETTLKQALEISQRIKDAVLEAGVHNNLGIALQYQNKIEAAAKEFDTARQIAEEQKDSLRAGSYNFNLGNALNRLNQNDNALAAFRRSAEQSKAASRADLEARATMMQGVTLSTISSVSAEPLKYLDRAQKMFEKLGDDQNAGWCLVLMADHSGYMQKFAEAAGLAEKAVPLFVKAGDNRGLTRCYFILSEMYKRIGDQTKSEKYQKLLEGLGKSPN